MKKIIIVFTVLLIFAEIAALAKYKEYIELNCFSFVVDDKIEINNEEKGDDKDIQIDKYKKNENEKLKLKGIENGGIYNESKKIEIDGEGKKIKLIEKIFYGDLIIGCKRKDDGIEIYILRTPKNIKELKYVRYENGVYNEIKTNKKYLKFNDVDFLEKTYYVCAEDFNGNISKSNVIFDGKSEYIVDDYIYDEEENICSKNGNYDIKVVDNENNEINCQFLIKK